jgi:hypothetical protein
MAFSLHTIKSIALAASIVIVLNLFVGMGIKTFYDRPQFNDFCPVDVPQYADQALCEAAGGKWYPLNTFPEKAPRIVPPPPAIDGTLQLQPYCDPYFTCQKQFEERDTVYTRNVFIIWVVTGLVSLLIGFRIAASPPVSSGFVFGGVVAFIVGTTTYWGDMDEYLRFIVLGIALAALIYIGYRKLGRNEG